MVLGKYKWKYEFHRQRIEVKKKKTKTMAIINFMTLFDELTDCVLEATNESER